jgi:hypothetical protein
MSALWAIVVDTWRQSRQQVVFMIMTGLLWLVALATIAGAQPVDVQDEDGQVREHVTLFGAEGSHVFLEEGWAAIYASTLMLQYDDPEDRPDPFSETGQKLQNDLLGSRTKPRGPSRSDVGWRSCSTASRRSCFR